MTAYRIGRQFFGTDKTSLPRAYHVSEIGAARFISDVLDKLACHGLVAFWR